MKQILMAGLGILGVVLAAQTAGAQGIGIDVGAKGPAATLTTMDGKPANLSTYVGKGPVLLEFWATWCPNCAELEPYMVKMAQTYGSKVKFVGVAVSVNETPARVKAFAAAHKLPLEILYDTDGNAADAYDAPATSFVVMLDATGKVVYTGLGGKQDLETTLRKLSH